MNLLISVLLALCSQTLFANQCFSAREVQLSCAGAPITFVYDDAAEVKCLCRAATAAVAFLKSLGLETTRTITIRLVEHLRDERQNDLFGAYNARTREVSILTYAKLEEYARNGGRVLGVPFSDDVWCSFAAHELAHAISEPYLGRQWHDHVHGEYISVVTQLWVLSAGTREQVLATFSEVEPYASRDEMSLLYYLIDPDRFSVKCYRHFLSLENPGTFIESLIHKKN